MVFVLLFFAVAAYSFFPKKLSINVEFDKSQQNQLALTAA